MVLVNKVNWDKIEMSVEEKIKYNVFWLNKCKRVLKDMGFIWIFGIFYNIYIIGVCLELEGF